MFADDLTLLAPIKKGLQSQFLIFRGCDCKVVTKSQISVNNVILVHDNKAIHLGHSLNTDDKDSIVSAVISQFWSSFNLFHADFGHIYCSE